MVDAKRIEQVKSTPNKSNKCKRNVTKIKVEVAKNSGSASGIKKVNVKKSKNATKKVKCTKCPRTFSKVSNLSIHFDSKHLGKRWECTECKELQVSKYSHIRHMANKHGKFEVNADMNEHYFGNRVQMTHKAKDAMIAELKQQVSKSDDMIVLMKTKIKEQFFEIAKLKAKNDGEEEFLAFYEKNLRQFEDETAEVCDDEEADVSGNVTEVENAIVNATAGKLLIFVVLFVLRDC